MLIDLNFVICKNEVKMKRGGKSDLCICNNGAAKAMKEDGTKRKTKVEQGSENSFTKNQPRSLGSAAAESRENEYDPLRFSRTDCEQRHLSGSGARRRSAGGILRQLKQIKEAHLSYVNNHTERLKARLAEDEEHRQNVIDDINILEKQIEELLEEE